MSYFSSLCALATHALRFFAMLHALCAKLYSLFAMSHKLSAIRYSISLCALRSALCVFLRNFAFCIFIIFIGSFSIAHADVYDVLSHFHPSLSFEEDYSDNINLTSANRQEDWITAIYPGLRFSTSRAEVTTPGLIQQAPTESSGMDLQYRLGLISYAKNVENNYVSQEGRLNTWYTGRELNLGLKDYFIRSEEPLERAYSTGALPNQTLLGIQRERSIYVRNVLEPSVAYQFGREDRIEINYRNMIYQNQDPAILNSQENYINPRLTYWFDIHNGVALEYGLTRGEFDLSPDFWGQTARGRYTYRFNRHTSIFGEYSYLRLNFESPGVDYEVYNPSIGIEHAFSSTLSGRAQFGYFWQNPEVGSSTTGISYDANITQRSEKTTFILSFQGGYTEDYFSAENLGFTKYYRTIGTVSHRLMARMTVGLSGLIERDEYTSSGRKDWTWQMGGNASYQILRWLILSLDLLHRENDSNVSDDDYYETRGIFLLSAAL
jgi:hypothetical protein